MLYIAIIHLIVVYDLHSEGAEFISNGYRGIICELQNKKLKNHAVHCGPGNLTSYAILTIVLVAMVTIQLHIIMYV